MSNYNNPQKESYRPSKGKETDPQNKSILSHFVQLNNSEELLKVLFYMIDTIPSSIAVLLFLSMRCSTYNTKQISLTDLEKHTGYNKRSVQRGIDILEEYGFLRHEQKKDGNIYYVNVYFCWKNERRLKYAAIQNGTVFYGPIGIPGKQPIEIDDRFFIQLSNVTIAVEDIMHICKQSSTAIKVFLLFVVKMNQTNEVQIKREVIAKTVNVSERDISRALTLLDRSNILEKRKCGSCYKYIINTKICFRDKAKNIDNYEYVGELHKLKPDFDDGIDDILKARLEREALEQEAEITQ